MRLFASLVPIMAIWGVSALAEGENLSEQSMMGSGVEDKLFEPSDGHEDGSCHSQMSRASYAMGGTCEGGSCSMGQDGTHGRRHDIDFDSISLPDDSLNHVLIALDGGTFTMGTSEPWFPQDGEGPARQVTVSPFLVDAYEVTNSQYFSFVRATKYRTEAEEYGWSFVFQGYLTDEELQHVDGHVPEASWWVPVKGSTWMTPLGPTRSTFLDTVVSKSNDPVTQVSWKDAKAFCEWRGMDLPTEAEWEFAARGGKKERVFPWGNKENPRDEIRTNVWQGEFPSFNSEEDGYYGVAPVNSFPPNGYGLHNVVGNVWEWTRDWWTVRHKAIHQDNPTGPPNGSKRVIKGGSYLCHPSTCYRYRIAARTGVAPDSGTGHLGFRCVKRLGNISAKPS